MSESNETIVQPPNIVSQVPVNPLLARGRLPGETFRLPSCGIFYNDGELDANVTDGEIHVHPMTAIDEITIASPAKLFSGDGVLEVISRCVPSILKPAELLAQDIDFILLCLRKVSYGTTFMIETTHPECKVERDEETPLKSHKYQIDIDKIINQTKEIDVASVSSTFRIELDNNQVLTMQPMRFNAYVKIMQMLSQNSDESSMTDIEQKNMILDQLAGMISTVDEISDKDMIREWLEIITPAQISHINKVISNMGEWGVNSMQKVACKDCKKKMELDMPTNPLALFS